ncbi:MAG TPA: VanW family protein, partial [Candidatus Dormibacteraeota bacterium]|nr:VanW family protein [Candidatus Dormibacteraeota bacterium]
MTSSSETVPPAAEAALSVGRTWPRFAIAFAIGLVAILAVGVAGMYAYDSAYDGRILPGVRVGTVDLSGKDRDQAAAALRSAYASYATGELVVHTSLGDRTIPYFDFGRSADVDAMIDAAMAVGRAGSPVDRGVAEVRTILRGVIVQPRVRLDETRLAGRIDSFLATLEKQPVDATISLGPSGIVTTPASAGRSFDRGAIQASALAAVGSLEAPASITVQAAVTESPARVTDAAVANARAAAQRMIADLVLTDGTDSWTVKADVVRGWIDFAVGNDGTVAAVVDQAAVATSLADVAKKVARAPVSATFLIGKDGSAVGATASRDGRSLDIPATVPAIVSALESRGGGTPAGPVTAALAIVPPKLSTADAQKAAPLMTRLGTWTTYFPIYEGNAFGANIWLPALTINGTVLAPGQTFDWWTVVGPVTAARGYGLGGFIAGDHTDRQGALGGGMCSSSTTLFNAALRAGLEMGARSNHTYYINRYPLGLDATVWVQGGARQTMTFTNDTKFPILVRGYKIQDGSRGYVRYDIYGVPDGRTVSLSTPIVQNVI